MRGTTVSSTRSLTIAPRHRVGLQRLWSPCVQTSSESSSSSIVDSCSSARVTSVALSQLRLLQTRLFERRGTTLGTGVLLLDAQLGPWQSGVYKPRETNPSLEARLHRHDPLRRHEALEAKLTGLTDRLVGVPAAILRERAQRLEVLERALHALSPSRS